ncbi:MAG: hypothetical protein V1722_01655 [Candidatus Micrarchaeota archaeon]
MKMRVPSTLLAAFIAAGCATPATPKIEMQPTIATAKMAVEAKPPKPPLPLRGTPQEQKLTLARLTAAHGLLTGQIKLSPTGTLKYPYQQVDVNDRRYANALSALIKEVDRDKNGLDPTEASKAITVAKNRLRVMKDDAKLLATELHALGAIPVFTTTVGEESNQNGLTVLTTADKSQAVEASLIGFLSSQNLISADDDSEYTLKRERGPLLRTRLHGYKLKSEQGRDPAQEIPKTEIPRLTEGKVGITVTFPRRIYSDENFHPVHLGFQYARDYVRRGQGAMHGSARGR